MFFDKTANNEPNENQVENNLMASYQNLKSVANEKGILPETVADIKKKFFTFEANQWRAHEAFWRPTGVVLGYPFPENLIKKMLELRQSILKDIGIKEDECWGLAGELLHVTVVSYSHYSETGLDCTKHIFPDTEIPKAEKILSSFKPITIKFCGVVITNDGSVLLKGFVADETLFSIRNKLKSDIAGITQKVPTIVHVKLAQILTNVSAETVKRVNAVYDTIDIGKQEFECAKLYNGRSLPFQGQLQEITNNNSNYQA